MAMNWALTPVASGSVPARHSRLFLPLLASLLAALIAFAASATPLRGADPDPVVGPTTLFTIDTGFDEETGETIPNGALDDHWVVVGPPGSAISDFATVVADDAWPVAPAGPWIASTAQSKWIGLDAPTSNGPKGTYSFEVRVHVPAGVAAEDLRLLGSWSSDNAGLDVVVNGTSTGISQDGNFTAWHAFPPDAALGLFTSGDNTLEILVENSSPDGNPVGLRVEAVVGTGVGGRYALDTALGLRGIGLLPAGQSDPHWRVTGPENSGIGRRAGLVVDDSGPPFPPWAANSARSRWLGLDRSARAAPPGLYAWERSFELPPELNAHRTSIAGRWAAASRGVELLVNGEPAGASSSNPGQLAPVPPGAGLGRLVPGLNTLRFQVEAEADISTGFRFEGELAPLPRADPLDLSTGVDRESGQVIEDGADDADYSVTAPDGTTSTAVAIGAARAPMPPWIEETPTSLWIGLPSGVDGPPGEYRYATTVRIDDPAAAESATIVGFWSADDEGLDVLVNGQTTGLLNQNGFGSATYFPPGAGEGLFREGENRVEFVVRNQGGTPNETGLRVDAAVIEGTVAPTEPLFRRADADASGTFNITDAIYALNFLFLGGPAPSCLDAADADDSGALNITDPVYILNRLFLGGPPPPAPGPDTCGPDPGPDDLDCAAFPPCEG